VEDCIRALNANTKVMVQADIAWVPGLPRLTAKKALHHYGQILWEEILLAPHIKVI
jgi:hypothetical protein